MSHFGRLLQLVALCILPMGLMAGFMENDVKFEMKVLAGAIVLFLIGKLLQGKGAPDSLE
ncbi:MAG: hypothetical protein QGF00_35170 [Planctomycetota bacterium]|jgi:hypothetical protein|nr:hypothetical protein [Planctomycetota bacterium]MDP7254892.1 hypothetical protein [Planctomycetota bacterium]